MKSVLIVMDGLGDRPIDEFKGKTPLEAAKTPNLDKLSASGVNGIMDTIAPGVTPGSDTSHLSLFGLDPEEHYHGRGPLEVLGVGVGLKHGDICLRANVGTVEPDMTIKDRRAGRIDSTAEHCKALDGLKIDGVEIILKPSAWYRAALVLRGKGLSPNVGKNDPKEVGVKVMEVKPLDNSTAAKKTAAVLNKLTKLAYEKFKDLPINKKRTATGKLPGNMLLFRGAGKYVPAPTLEERFGIKAACVAGGGLYKGVARYVGMEVIDVPGATGRYDSDYDAMVKAVKAALDDHDLVFLHFKATDSAGEDGNPQLKKEMIEKMDKAIGGLLSLKDCIIVATADHTTPCSLKHHSYEPVPVVMAAPGVRTDDVIAFGERSCAKGGLHRMRGLDLIHVILAHMGVLKLYGA